MPLFLKHSEHDLELIPFECSLAEKQVWGKGFMCVDLCQEHGWAREKKKKKKMRKRMKKSSK